MFLVQDNWDDPTKWPILFNPGEVASLILHALESMAERCWKPKNVSKVWRWPKSLKACTSQLEHHTSVTSPIGQILQSFSRWFPSQAGYADASMLLGCRKSPMVAWPACQMADPAGLPRWMRSSNRWDLNNRKTVDTNVLESVNLYDNLCKSGILYLCYDVILCMLWLAHCITGKKNNTCCRSVTLNNRKNTEVTWSLDAAADGGMNGLTSLYAL